MKSHYTSGDLAEMYSLQPWQCRQAMDSLGATRIPRIGPARALPHEMLGEFEREVRRRGWMDAVTELSAKGRAC